MGKEIEWDRQIMWIIKTTGSWGEGRARMLTWTLKYVTGTCNTEGDWRPA